MVLERKRPSRPLVLGGDDFQVGFVGAEQDFFVGMAGFVFVPDGEAVRATRGDLHNLDRTLGGNAFEG